MQSRLGSLHSAFSLPGICCPPQKQFFGVFLVQLLERRGLHHGIQSVERSGCPGISRSVGSFLDSSLRLPTHGAALTPALVSCGKAMHRLGCGILSWKTKTNQELLLPCFPRKVFDTAWMLMYLCGICYCWLCRSVHVLSAIS